MRTATAMLVLACSCSFLRAQAPAKAAAPPNEPASVQFVPATGELTIRYGEAVLFAGRAVVRVRPAVPSASDILFSLEEARGERDSIEQKIRLRLPRTSAGTIEVNGTVHASGEAFAAETFSQAQLDFPLVRTSSGPDHNLRNNAVYDRHSDWVLIGPSDGHTIITPGSHNESESSFQVQVWGRDLVLAFKPRFYQLHRKITFFQPWTYRVWPDSVAGWSSWWAYKDGINEDIVRQVTDIFADKLRDFGYRYIQLDDGYHLRNGYPAEATKTNTKFPSGLRRLAQYISSKGLLPAIWENVAVDDEQLVKEHPRWFYNGPTGTPFKAPWIGYGIDGTNAAAIDALIRPTYRELRADGFRYVKVDALRHLLYDASYKAAPYLEAKGSTPAQAFRNVLQAVRDELGPDTYLLACWGVLPEVVGIADASRLGTDGFGPHTLAEYNSWNNVVWRNDPDHVDIGGEGEDIIRPVLTSMAGAQLLLSDPVELYGNDSKLEGARRSAPVLTTLPGQLYDYDPTATNNLMAGLRNSNGGAEPGPIDGEQFGNVPQWWLMDVSRKFENWSVLARLAWHDLQPATVRFVDLGLPPDKQYIVYEFWTKKLVGIFKGAFPAVQQKAKDVRVYAIRELQARPQIVSTSRHISQGGVDLIDVQWSAADMQLAGESEVVARDPYRIVLHVPDGFAVDNAVVDGKPAHVSNNGSIVEVSLVPQATGRVSWSIHFRAAPDVVSR